MNRAIRFKITPRRKAIVASFLQGKMRMYEATKALRITRMQFYAMMTALYRDQVTKGHIDIIKTLKDY